MPTCCAEHTGVCVSKPTKRTLKPSSIQTEYAPTAVDGRAARDLIEKCDKAPPFLRLKVKNRGGEIDIKVDYPDQAAGQVHLMAAIGVIDNALYGSLVGNLANLAVVGEGDVSELELNELWATVREIHPRDTTEALLAVQMAAIHRATITAARRLKRVDTIPQQDSASNMLNKLARTFAAQVETLKKYRATGEQNIRVQHVTVNDGGQAIVGDMPTRGGGTYEKPRQSHAPSEPSQSGPTLLGHEQAIPMPLPIASREGPDCLPNARGTSGCAEGQSKRRLAARDGDE